MFHLILYYGNVKIQIRPRVNKVHVSQDNKLSLLVAWKKRIKIFIVGIAFLSENS